MPQTATPTLIDPAIVRALAYSLLAYGLTYPDDEKLGVVREIADTAGEALRGTPLSGLLATAARVSRANLEPHYVSLCTLSSSPDCPTFETAYYSGDPQQQTARMADVAGFYRAFGVETTGSGLRPDDISVELEFMAYLCRKEVHARKHMGAPRVAQAVRAQRLFLQEHLGTWGRALGQRIAARADSDFYARAGIALAEWVGDDCERLSATPIEVSGEPVIPPPDPVSHGPEMPGMGLPVFALDDIPVM